MIDSEYNSKNSIKRRVSMKIIIDDLTNEQSQGLIGLHLADMAGNSPPESMHALSVDGLKQADMTFYSAWEGSEIMGCGALKELSQTEAELKSMRTVEKHLRKSVAAAILQRIIDDAIERGFTTLSLETGSMDAFKPAHRLYERFGFIACGPFSQYKEDLNSVFMTKELTCRV